MFGHFDEKLKELINFCNIKDKKELISDIVLIGGSSKMPKFKRF